MNKKLLMRAALCVLPMAFFPIAAVADPQLITTGSAELDVTLQWLTSLVTLASIVANFTPSPVDNAGVKILSIVVNFFAGNWKQIQAAWTDRNKIGAYVIFASGLTLLVALSPSQAVAASCAIVGGSCPAGTLCARWPQATTRKSGAALPANEIKGYKIAIDGTMLPLTATLSLNYAVPEGTTLSTATVVQIWTVDSTDQQSETPFSCTLPVAITVPKSPPLAPVLSVIQN